MLYDISALLTQVIDTVYYEKTIIIPLPINAYATSNSVSPNNTQKSKRSQNLLTVKGKSVA